MLTYLLLAMHLSLAFVFTLSALAKAQHPRAFVRNVVEYEVLPAQLAYVVGWALVPVEVFLAVAFLTGWLSPVALPLAMVSLISFLIAVGVNLKRGRKIPCGCFGDATEQVSIRTAVRLTMLILVVIVLMALSDSASASLPSLPVLLDDSSSRMYLIQTSFVAAFITLLGSWLLHLPELMSLLQSFRLNLKSSRQSASR